MGQYILKVNPIPEEDFYVVWTTYMDTFCAWGTWKELEEMSADYIGDPALASYRKERADKWGSSSMNGWYGFDDEEFLVHNMGHTAPWVFPRKNIGPFLREWETYGSDEKGWDALNDKDIQQTLMEKYATKFSPED